jgi:membrane-bound lytic murein transglycosylase D
VSSKKIFQILNQANIQIPSNKEERISFFQKLRKNIRTQTGQKNFIRDGIKRSLPYQSFITRYFNQRKLPRELIAIPFLESSFNPRAQSKVNALGAWQFMPLISSYFVPYRTDKYDYRSNVGVASVAAGFLMSENYQIMKSWDLAVTAYNSGTKHLLRTKRKLSSSKVNLQDVIENSNSDHFGFASKNFYSEFLALAHTLAYREELFENLHTSDRDDVEDELKFFISKCKINFRKKLSNEILDDIIFHNDQVSDKLTSIPRGFIFTTKATLPAEYFIQVSEHDMLKRRPKDWDKVLKRHSCSTK